MFIYFRLADIYAYFGNLLTGLLLIQGASVAELLCDLLFTGDFISFFEIVEVKLPIYTS